MARVGPTHPHDDEVCGDGRVTECTCPCVLCEGARHIIAGEVSAHFVDAEHTVDLAMGELTVSLSPFHEPPSRAS